MKKILLIIIMISFLSIKAQKIKGTWKVLKVIEHTDSVGYNSLAKGFDTATFRFNEDHTVKITTKTPSFMIVTLINAVKSLKWQMDSKTNWTLIGYDETTATTGKNHEDTLTQNTGLIIELVKENNKSYFKIADGNFKILVLKEA